MDGWGEVGDFDDIKRDIGNNGRLYYVQQTGRVILQPKYSRRQKQNDSIGVMDFGKDHVLITNDL